MSKDIGARRAAVRWARERNGKQKGIAYLYMVEIAVDQFGLAVRGSASCVSRKAWAVELVSRD
jgi:hypothetical protein